jgi:hypothetical protein
LTAGYLLPAFHLSNSVFSKKKTAFSYTTIMTSDYGATASANGFGNRIGWGKRPALVLIDVCKAYWTAGSPLDTSSNPASVASTDVMKNLVSAAREAKIPLIWTVVKYKNDMSDAGLFYSKAKQLRIWREDADEGYADWVEGLVPVEGEEVVPKRYVWSPMSVCLYG